MSARKVGPIRHAPWSKWFRTFYVNGWHSHELQIGPLIIRVRHETHKIAFGRDPYWRT